MCEEVPNSPYLWHVSLPFVPLPSSVCPGHQDDGAKVGSLCLCKLDLDLCYAQPRCLVHEEVMRIPHASLGRRLLFVRAVDFGAEVAHDARGLLLVTAVVDEALADHFEAAFELGLNDDGDA